ncbi:MAG: hypothetical protein ABIH26_09395 [Candidatus Eisenbacteria bacterium]
MNPRDPALRPRRLTVSGGSVLSDRSKSFCAALGEALAGQAGLVVVTGGLRALTASPEEPAAEWLALNAMTRELDRRGIPPEERVETLLPGRDWEGADRFRIGRVVVLRNRSPQSRRFSLVSSTDATLTIEGGRGTAQVIDLALAIEKPVLPLPFTGGASRKRWDENREQIMHWFGMDEEAAGRFEAASPSEMSHAERKDLAEEALRFLIPALRRKCFIAMPFSEDLRPVYEVAIKPAVRASGLRDVRADQLDLVGNALEILRQGILFCDVIVADLTGSNPNVLYELGLAHAQNKPGILICKRREDGGLPELPFDVLHEQVIGYDPREPAALRTTLERKLRRMFGPE